MIGASFWFVAILLAHSRTASAQNGGRDADSLKFAGRSQLDHSEYRTHRRPQNSGDGSYIENLFKIPIAVIKGTAAAAQTYSPQNSEVIDKIFDIPVSTLGAVGNFIRESRPQRVSNDNNGQTIQAPTRRDERRERIMKIREDELTRRRLIEQERRRRRLIEQERQRRRIEEQEKISQQGNHRTFDLASGLIDLLVGNSGGGFFGTQGHGQGHGHHGLHGRPHRPSRPSRPFKPQGHVGHAGSHGNFQSGNGAYQVYEGINEKPVYSGIFSWLQASQQNDRIQNKIAPGAEYLDDREPAELRYSRARR